MVHSKQAALERNWRDNRRLHMFRFRVQALALLLAASSLGLTAAARVTVAQEGPAPSGSPVTVSVDAATYAPGDPITATVTNGGSDALSPSGGIVCQGSPWPFSIQVLDASAWLDVPVTRTPPCVAIAAALLQPGESASKSFTLALDAGQYRVVYVYHAMGGTDGAATSDPFVIDNTSD
jgi:hypothetical protein